MNPYIRAGFMTVGVAAALALLALGFFAGDTDEAELPAGIESIRPADGALISPQGAVGADLADEFSGILVVDGVEIPTTHLSIVEPLGQVYFTPGPGKQVAGFEAGRHAISVVYWPKSQSRADASTFGWEFRVG